MQAVQWAEYITGKEKTVIHAPIASVLLGGKNIDRSGKMRRINGLINSDLRVKLIVAKAVYNTKRQSNKISEQFREFLESGIKPITSDPETGPKVFEKFCLLFEAVVGYATQYTKDER